MRKRYSALTVKQQASINRKCHNHRPYINCGYSEKEIQCTDSQTTSEYEQEMQLSQTICQLRVQGERDTVH